MDEQRVQAYWQLIQAILDCPSEANQLLNDFNMLMSLDEGFVYVCELVVAQLQARGEENPAAFLQTVAQDVDAFLVKRGDRGNRQAALRQLWGQLLQAEIEGDTATLYQVMRQNMGLIVPALGDTIAQFMKEALARNKGEAELLALFVQYTCASIQQFPYGRYGELQEIAIRVYGVLLELWVDNPERRADTLNNLGYAQLFKARLGINSTDNLERAIVAYDEAAGILRQLGLEKELSSTLANLGVARSTQAEMGINPGANFQSAIAAYDEAAGILRCLQLEKDLAGTLTNLGSAYRTQAELGLDLTSNLSKAITTLTEAVVILRRLGSEEGLASALNNLGNAYRTQAQLGIDPFISLDEAIVALTEAAAIRGRLGLEKDLVTTLTNLGVVCRTQAGRRVDLSTNLDKAITAFSEAVAICRRLELEKDLARCLHELGVVVYMTQAKFDIDPTIKGKCIAIFTEAAAICRRLGLERELAQILTDLGGFYATQVQFALAPASQDEYDEYITVLTESAGISRRLGLERNLAFVLHNMGYIRLAQAQVGMEPEANLECAILAYDEAAGIRRRLGLAGDLATTLNNFGFAYKAQSRLAGNSSPQKQQALENAYQSFQEALEQVEYLRGEIGADSEGYKRNFNEEWNKVYRGMVEVCLELGRYQDAIEYVDRSKARNLVELIATRDVYPGGVMPENVRQQLQSLKNAIAQAERRLQDEENPDPTHLNLLRQQKQELEPYKPLHFQGMQELLDEDTVILEWYILGDKFLTFTLTAERLNLWTSSEEDLKQLGDWGENYLNAYYQAKEPLQRAIEALKAAQTEAEQQQAERLLKEAQDIWQNPLAERLEALAQILHLDEILANLRQNFPNCQKLILIPHRYLHLFPLHALPVATEDGEGQFLQDLFPKGVAYAPNCQLLQQAQNRSRPDFNRLFVIQNPRGDLDWADVEIENIRTLFPDRNTLARKNATTAKLLDEKRRELLSQTHHLFFSCHAAFNPTSPLDSGLELADGVLTLENIIANLNLKECSLVTLSACETGQVAIDDTDEYISLSSGFILAGSPSVLVSLWSVNEVSTALLLIRTYELLQQKPGQLTEALQAAQKWLRETTASGFEQWWQQCPLVSNEWREELKDDFARMGQNKQGGINHRPYQSPYHWGAFTIVGQGA